MHGSGPALVVGSGTGLGLPICHALAEHAVERVLREGTLVGLANHTVLVARDGSQRPIADSGAPIRYRSRGPAPPLAADGRGRVLVVDDEISIANVVPRILRKNHDVLPMVDAREALALLRGGEHFDIILCDLDDAAAQRHGLLRRARGERSGAGE